MDIHLDVTLDVIFDIKIQVVFFDVHKYPSPKIMKTSHKTQGSYNDTPLIYCTSIKKHRRNNNE